MEPKNIFQQLNKIKKVEAPPFLFTRIEQQIRNKQEDKAPIRWVFVGSLTFIFLFLLNVSLINSTFKTERYSDDFQTIIEDMNLNSSNQLYHE